MENTVFMGVGGARGWHLLPGGAWEEVGVGFPSQVEREEAAFSRHGLGENRSKDRRRETQRRGKPSCPRGSSTASRLQGYRKKYF